MILKYTSWTGNKAWVNNIVSINVAKHVPVMDEDFDNDDNDVDVEAAYATRLEVSYEAGETVVHHDYLISMNECYLVNHDGETIDIIQRPIGR